MKDFIEKVDKKIEGNTKSRRIISLLFGLFSIGLLFKIELPYLKIVTVTTYISDNKQSPIFDLGLVGL